ncbi:serine/arginine repetitive matrix protein 1-like isoform X2 [Physella acuta]|uniref:serine/arginine repetitive matrix protein 1-like isoform X2 n=1 Tax=Physella acuta TaxID=109671 RepID=UPI0027DB893A|nr:serine/arginine repetitive matrix protein 1-like isoform X2 [Physella acuta]
MVIKRKDFQKAAAFIHEFLLKLSEDVECADVRDTLNLALLHMQKYYRLIQNRSQEKCANTLSLTARGLSPMTPFVDAPDKFIWRWINLDSTKLPATMSLGDSVSFVSLPSIIIAVKAGDIDLISELLHQDPGCADSVDGLGRTGIMYAVHFNQHETLRFLLEQKSDVNTQAHDGSTALHRACHDGNHVGLQLLVDYGGDLDICDVQGRAPIHWAVTTRSTECLQILLAHQAFCGIRDKDGLTPSMWACRMDNIKHFELLCKADNSRVEESDGIERDANGRTWMHWSVRRTQPLECLQTLLTPDSAAIKDEDGKTVLLVAAEMGSLNACRLIVEIAGEKCILDQDNQGRTALHLATMGGHGDVVNFLLEKNADVNVVDMFNATAWDYARIRKLHYCQLIIMSHQRQRLSSNPASPMPNGLGLFMKEESAVQDDFSRMSFRTRSNQSTPITPPHPPKRPRSTHMLARRSSSFNSLDREQRADQDKMNQSQDRFSLPSGRRERLSINITGPQKRTSNGEVLTNTREDTMMTDSSRPVFEDENDEISVGEMDVSDIEDEDHTVPASRGSSSQAHRTHRPRPQPRVRPQQMGGAPSPPSLPQNVLAVHNNQKRSFATNMNTNNNNNSNLPIQQHYPRMDFEDAASGPSPRTADNQQLKSVLGPQLARPQARVPPTPIYRPQRGGPIPSPPSSTPQRPHMIRQQQPLPPSASRNPGPPQSQQPREPTPPMGRDPSPPLSSQSSEPQHSSKSQGHTQGERPSSGGNQPPGVLEGRRIPPPALTPLQNAPKPPNLDMFDQVDKKKKKKKKDKDKRDAKSPPQKAENPSDIPPPRGFAAPLHPHMQGSPGSRINSAAPFPPRPSKGVPAMSESRYVDENQEEGASPPVVNGFAVHMRDGKSARPGHRLADPAPEPAAQDGDEGESMMQTSIAEEEEDNPLIPPPPSFRGAARGGNKALTQSVPQPNLPILHPAGQELVHDPDQC